MIPEAGVLPQKRRVLPSFVPMDTSLSLARARAGTRYRNSIYSKSRELLFAADGTHLRPRDATTSEKTRKPAFVLIVRQSFNDFLCRASTTFDILPTTLAENVRTASPLSCRRQAAPKIGRSIKSPIKVSVFHVVTSQ